MGITVIDLFNVILTLSGVYQNFLPYRDFCQIFMIGLSQNRVFDILIFILSKATSIILVHEKIKLLAGWFTVLLQ